MRIRLEPWFHPGKNEVLIEATFEASKDWLRIDGYGCLVVVLDDDEIARLEKALEEYHRKNERGEKP